MTLLSKIKDVLGPLKSPSKVELKNALLQLNITVNNLADFQSHPKESRTIESFYLKMKRSSCS